MDNLPALAHPTIDADGFASGSIAESAVNPLNVVSVVTAPVPEGPLAPLRRWRWRGGAWAGELDYRGFTFYNPANTSQEHNPARFDDAPPEGWTHWVPGENKVVGAAEGLRSAKAAKWSEVKQARDAAELSTFTYGALVLDGDLDAQRRLAAYISVSKSALAAGQPFAADFTLTNNAQVTLSAADFVGIEMAKVQSVAAAFARATALRAQIDSAQSEAALAGISF